MAESGSSSAEQTRLKFIKKNGGTILLRAGYQFYARRKHKSGLTVWACTKRKTCKGILRLKDQQILEETAHVCVPDFANNQIEESLHELKSELIKPDFPPVSQSYNTMLGNLEDAGINIISEVPKFTSIKSTLYRVRNVGAGVSKMRHKKAVEFEVPPLYKDFVLADYLCNMDNIRIVAFSSLKAREIMSKETNFYGDGTFSSCPSPFVELYTIHADTGSTTDHTNIKPLVYALMSDRKTKTYIVLFRIIKSQLPNWNPLKFKIDYESAVMKAIAVVFPSTTTKGCYYHYNKAIFKKGKQLNLTTSSDLKEVRMVQLSAVLPLIPEHQIFNGWVYIIARYGDGDDTASKKKFIDYMEKQWLREDFIKMWCVFGEIHRTTNALEAWHSKLNRAMKIKNPNIMQFLRVLKDDSSQCTVKNILEQQNKSPKRKRTKKIVKNDEFIQEVQLELTLDQVTVGHALEILRH